MSAADASWAAVARDTREALRYLGHPIEPMCLPGELQECGGSYAEHAAAQLATIIAIARHQLAHLGAEWQPLVDEVMLEQCAQLAGACDVCPPVGLCEHTEADA